MGYERSHHFLVLELKLDPVNPSGCFLDTFLFARLQRQQGSLLGGLSLSLCSFATPVEVFMG